MPSNDDLKYQNENEAKGRASGDASVASALPYDHTVGADETIVNEASINETSADETSAQPLSSDHGMPQEFTFFQKKKRTGDATLTPALSYASVAQMTAFITRLDSAVATNSKTQRHIADLQILMADVACTMTTDAPKPARKTLRRSKWLFYGCLAVFGIGWFLLFPSGHNLLTQLVAFLAG